MNMTAPALDNVTAVILAGGVGSRLWPLSREEYPKQFISVENELSLLNNTLQRLPALGIKKAIVICNQAHRFLVAENLRQHDLLNENIILEPFGKNTAAAVALAALDVTSKQSDDPMLLVLAADHIIKQVEAFREAVVNGYAAASEGRLVTFGIVPDYPETGYGYIAIGQPIDGAVSNVARFVEKPTLEVARSYLASGDYLWNSGMFLFKAETFLSELERFRPQILASCKTAFERAAKDLDFIRIDPQAFALCPSESIDYAIMEPSDNKAVVPLNAGWSDVGSWSSVWDVSEKNSNNNCLIGDVISVETSNSYIRAETMLVATVGVQDLIIVQTEDAVLVADKNQTQNVKVIVDELKSQQRSECINNKDSFKHWGRLHEINDAGDYRINKLHIDPGRKITYQYHNHRVESWYILAGSARVNIKGVISLLGPGDCVAIKPAQHHSIENASVEEPLLVIEIQHGKDINDADVERI